ncbi:NusG domain II-containing protein [Lacticaseibacillus mingshuiensis]|uniref:NusG domain II-containing protein n=1 Tax=Lacticaseibacillus mingshuiensis TaxID=2799574 RepID=A0ABW4CGL8_9LACO|nr:NusG domain II-containing protein [Lacticaseibacillus mingshuiensis]
MDHGIRKYLHMIRPFDVIIVVALMLAAFIPYVVFARQQAQEKATRTEPAVYTAVVTHDGKEVYRLKLTGHKGTTRFRYNDGDEWNEIVATGSKIAIKEANCKDQVCVREGQISRPGQTIVCLPHKLLIEIKSTTASSGNNTGGMVTE